MQLGVAEARVQLGAAERPSLRLKRRELRRGGARTALAHRVLPVLRPVCEQCVHKHKLHHGFDDRHRPR